MRIAIIILLWFASRVWGGINEWTYVGLAPEEIADIEVHPVNPDIIYASALDIFWDEAREGGLFKTTDRGLTWDTLGFRHYNVFDVCIDPVRPDTLWAAVDLLGVFRSTDGGAVWESRSAGLPLGGTDRKGAFAVAVNPANPLEVIASARGDMGLGWTYKSTDAGASWNLVDPTLTLMRICFDSLVAGRVYANSYNSEGVQISDDNGSTFRWTQNINAVTDIAPDPFQPNGIWVMRSQSFIYTPDTGATWIEPDTTFPPTLGRGLVVVASPVAQGHLFVATSRHSYRTTSGGLDWSELIAGLPIGEIDILSLIASRPPELWLSTAIGGLYTYSVIDSLPVAEDPHAETASGLVIYPNPVHSEFYIGGLRDGSGTITLYNLLGQQVNMLSLHPAGSRHMARLPAALPAGKYFGIIEQPQRPPERITVTITK